MLSFWHAWFDLGHMMWLVKDIINDIILFDLILYHDLIWFDLTWYFLFDNYKDESISKYIYSSQSHYHLFHKAIFALETMIANNQW